MSSSSTINYYFAYGSNMDSSQMDQRWITGSQRLWPTEKNGEVSTAKIIGTALLPNYILNFDKISLANPNVNFASISFRQDSIVEGVLYELNEKFIEILDFYEGVKTHQYTREVREVMLKTSLLAGRQLNAYVYVAHPEASIKTGRIGTPSKKYLDTLLRGARDAGLCENLIAKLENWPTAE